MRLKLISCEVFVREFSHAAARSPHQIDTEFLPKGLHDIGCVGMLDRLQKAVDAVDAAQYDAILLGYGLCNYGIAGLCARHIPIVVPRAHDCMALFFGDRERYLTYFEQNPGTYFLTSGWIERGEATGELRQLSIQHRNGMDLTYEELVEKYGEDNARYLYDELCNWTRHYSRLTFIAMGVEPEKLFESVARERAAAHGWEFDRVVGDMRLLSNLADGVWEEDDVLVLRPGDRKSVV